MSPDRSTQNFEPLTARERESLYYLLERTDLTVDDATRLIQLERRRQAEEPSREGPKVVEVARNHLFEPGEAERLSHVHAGPGSAASGKIVNQLTSELADRMNATVSVVLVGAARAWAMARHNDSPDMDIAANRELSFCTHVVSADKRLVIDDVNVDQLFRDHPYMSEVGAYAGAPIVVEGGYTVGAVCIVHPDAHDFTASELEQLDQCAAQVGEVLNNEAPPSN